MKRTACHIVRTLFLQPDIRADHINNIVSGADLLHQLLRIIHNNPAKGEEKKAEAMIEQLYYYYAGHLELLPEEYCRMIKQRQEPDYRVVCISVFSRSRGLRPRMLDSSSGISSSVIICPRTASSMS